MSGFGFALLYCIGFNVLSSLLPSSSYRPVSYIVDVKFGIGANGFILIY
jgi:hypothetical protein